MKLPPKPSKAINAAINGIMDGPSGRKSMINTPSDIGNPIADQKIIIATSATISNNPRITLPPPKAFAPLRLRARKEKR
jgi:hypothetical protein